MKKEVKKAKTIARSLNKHTNPTFHKLLKKTETCHNQKLAANTKTRTKTNTIEQASFETTKTPNVVYSLQQIQDKHGYLPSEELIRLSKVNGIPGVNIYGVATFYNQFKLNKPAKYIVSICRGTACHVRNSEGLLEYAEELLNIKAGESTPDGLISLEIVRCIGACAKAPAIMINDTVYGELDKEKLKKLLESLK